MGQRLDLSLNEILASVPGRLLHAEIPLLNADAGTGYSEMAFDSRKVSQSCIFLCHKGERVDGHDYISEAVRAGAKLIIGDNEKKISEAAKALPDTQFYIVQSSLGALQKMAAFYRRKFPIPTIGITGSSGKTTTKDLLAGIFANAKPALVTEGTLNNHWGVPQMVMRLRSQHRAAAFEMGINHFGELTELCSICQPDIGLITTIGSSHLEGLGNEEGVLKAKRELFDWIVEHGRSRVLIFNLDNPHLEKLHAEFLARKEKTLKLLTITQRKTYADVRLVSRKALGLEHRFGWEYEFDTPWGAVKGRLPLPGAHNLGNAMAAATLALSSGIVNVQDVVQGLDRPQLTKLRSDLFRSPTGALIYDDSYNANPTSVTALFDAARTIRTNGQTGLSKTVAVVGDMLELGADATELHRKMGRMAAREGIDVLLATGQHARAWVEGYRDEKGISVLGAALDFKDQNDLFVALTEELKAKPEETLVLIKGSRGAKMDRIVARIRGAS
jgi:UDP-N-acetylmuramoyl-tripeptide--D-alanyl-D-alanine ligase